MIVGILTQIPHNTQKTKEPSWKEIRGKKRNSPEKIMPRKQSKMDRLAGKQITSSKNSKKSSTI